MKLEDQCCSLELAKRLKELGVKDRSDFFWNEDGRLYYRFDRVMEVIIWRQKEGPGTEDHPHRSRRIITCIHGKELAKEQ